MKLIINNIILLLFSLSLFVIIKSVIIIKVIPKCKYMASKNGISDIVFLSENGFFPNDNPKNNIDQNSIVIE